MSLQVCGHRLLVLPDPVEKKTESGIVLVKDERAYREATMQGTVVQIGATAFDFNDKHNKPWCEVGDKIIYARHAGKFVEDPDEIDPETNKPKEYYVINDEDVQVIVRKTK